MNQLVKNLFVVMIVLLAFPLLMNSIFSLGFENNSILYSYLFIALVGLGWILNSSRKDFFEIRLSAFITMILLGLSLVMLLLKEVIGAKGFAFFAAAFFLITILTYLRKHLLSLR